MKARFIICHIGKSSNHIKCKIAEGIAGLRKDLNCPANSTFVVSKSTEEAVGDLRLITVT